MIRCKKCGDTIESKHRHDFRSCSCGSVSIDGGRDYTRILWPGGEPADHYEWVVTPKVEGVRP
jgi:hypothetical protein